MPQTALNERAFVRWDMDGLSKGKTIVTQSPGCCTQAFPKAEYRLTIKRRFALAVGGSSVPIQFACDHCGGTLSIAKRKAYSLIDCPKCGCKQVVPAESRGNGTAKNVATTAQGSVKTIERSAAVKDLPLFEREDFENLLEPAKNRLPEPAKTKPVEAITVVPVTAAPVDPNRELRDLASGVELMDRGGRVTLHRNHLILAAVLVLVLIGLAFTLGFIVARVVTPR
jgi:phage FluMu protein Com